MHAGTALEQVFAISYCMSKTEIIVTLLWLWQIIVKHDQEMSK